MGRPPVIDAISGGVPHFNPPWRGDRDCDLDGSPFHSEDRDHPLVLRYLPPEGWLDPLGLQPARSKRHAQARAQILAIALDKASHRQPCVSYSRNHNHYGKRGRRYDELPDLYRYGTIVTTVDALAAAGLLHN